MLVVLEDVLVHPKIGIRLMAAYRLITNLIINGITVLSRPCELPSQDISIPI